MVIIPGWLVLCFFILPVLLVIVLSITFVFTTCQMLYIIFKKDRYVNKFYEYTRMLECTVTVPMCVSIMCTVVGIAVGVDPRHLAIGAWYLLMNAFTVLYIVYVIDYYNLKRKGMLG